MERHEHAGKQNSELAGYPLQAGKEKSTYRQTVSTFSIWWSYAESNRRPLDCHFLEDREGYKMELRFLRDTDKREIDFVVLQDRAPVFGVECKTGDSGINPAIHYFKERTNIPAFYQVHNGKKDYLKDGIRVLPIEKFCKELQLP